MGWLGDRTSRRRVASAAFVMMAVGMLCFGLAVVVDMRLIWISLVVFSIGYGGGTVMRVSLTREFFGRANFGSVFGILIAVNMIGSIISPTLVGWMYDLQQSYMVIWLIYALLIILAGVAIQACPVPRR